MSERYTRLFALEENLYSEGSPVVVSAGALLKDNQTGAVLAQLKIKNIGDKRVKAAAVRITCFDTLGKPLEGAVEKEYLDLDTGRGAEFGQKTLVSLPDASTRSFSVSVAWVAFSDNMVWNPSEEALSALPKQDSLSKALGDEELVKQYRLKYGAGTKSFPRKYKDLWFCACGALNRADEEDCHVCGQKLANLLPFDAEALKAEKDARLQKEADERRRAEEQAKAAAEEKAARAKKAAQKAKKIAAIVIPVVCACAAFVLLLTQVIIPKQKYNKAMSLIDAGEYQTAYGILEKIGKPEAIVQNKYDRAMACIDKGEYGTAFNLLTEIGKADDFTEESKYDWAMTLLDEKNYDDAYKLFKEIDHEDSKEQWKKIRARYYDYDSIAAAGIGDTFFFGSYEQDNNTSDGKEDIEWIVLTKKDNKLLVISRYALACQPYAAEGDHATWETCALRSWLNENFINEAFSSSIMQEIIPETTVPAQNNPEYEMADPGNDTQDKIFLLSITEAKTFFNKKIPMECAPTAYAAAQGAYRADNGNTWWWLRTPGFLDMPRAAGGTYDGGISYIGNALYISSSVRPAMWIDLSK